MSWLAEPLPFNVLYPFAVIFKTDPYKVRYLRCLVPETYRIPASARSSIPLDSLIYSELSSQPPPSVHVPSESSDGHREYYGQYMNNASTARIDMNDVPDKFKISVGFVAIFIRLSF